MTNLQWFRTADIFDVAEELNSKIDCPRSNMQTDKCTQFDGCIECWADWLMQERKEDGEE
jgi:hypothetical protein